MCGTDNKKGNNNIFMNAQNDLSNHTRSSSSPLTHELHDQLPMSLSHDEHDWRRSEVEIDDNDDHVDGEEDDFSELSRSERDNDDATNVDTNAISALDLFGASFYSKKSPHQEEVAKLAHKESKKERAWRCNVFFMLAITASLLISLTFIFLRNENQDDFSASFHQYALTIRQALRFSMLGVVDATGGLSEYITAGAIQTQSEWPFTTLSGFEVYAKHKRIQASSELVVVAPFVAQNQIQDWGNYSVQHQTWIEESFAIINGTATNFTAGSDTNTTSIKQQDIDPISPYIYRFDQSNGQNVIQPDDGSNSQNFPLAPLWQMSRPPIYTSIINLNVLSMEEYQDMYTNMMTTRQWVFGGAGPSVLTDYTLSQQDHDTLHNKGTQVKFDGVGNDYPHTVLVYPVFRELNYYNGENNENEIVAMLISVLSWDSYLKNLLPEDVDGIYCVLHNSLGQVFTYVIDGIDAYYLGEGDFHETLYDSHEVIIDFDDIFVQRDNANGSNNRNKKFGTQYWFAVYPSGELESSYESNIPKTFASVAGAAFFMVTVSFLFYNWYAIRKNNKIMDAASRSNAILSSLFPKHVKNKLLEQEEEKEATKQGGVEWTKATDLGTYMLNNLNNNLVADIGGMLGITTTNHAFTVGNVANNHKNNTVRGDDDDEDDEIMRGKPIADLFPEATVLFADLVGFTAWSSTREPTSVFILLETLFKAFDKIAKRKRVYKVETIGDCYVAVTGVPEPTPKHAEIMCRFSREILLKMQQLTKRLEEKLGPDTSNLSMRFGIHSGPVTAGVLRGERSRFQLFGDTMNTASRIESSGQPGRIHLSQETADILIAAGKGHLLEKREDKIVAKGKGEMQTYWLLQSGRVGSIAPSIIEGGKGGPLQPINSLTQAPSSGRNFASMPQTPRTNPTNENDDRNQRLIQWNISCFRALLKSIAAARERDKGRRQRAALRDDGSNQTATTELSGKIPLDEVTEVINLAELDDGNGVKQSPSSSSLSSALDIEPIQLHPDAESQLSEYITLISEMYEEHSFHCFQHASHVVMSVLKLLSRFQDQRGKKNMDMIPEKSGNNTNSNQSLGCFTADPLIQFACAFTALIHDILHPGVSNDILIKEEPDVAEFYKYRSVAEQRSLDVAWELLMEDKFAALRSAIYQTREEEERFRQLVVNCLMATDVMDPDLKKLRTDRWNRAFSSEQRDSSSKQSIDRKVTILIEHLIQTSDVSHTMQHWKVFRKWNEKLFQEMYKAYMDGRSNQDPSEFWYEGEIKFFDYYVIPLAERLEEVGDMLGITRGSDEYLVYAKKNRKEWEEKGIQIVEDMKTQYLAENEATTRVHDSGIQQQ